ncbi:MAG TPA: hypothetical protein VHZ07_20190 [Bryobacteraceae bacterium]|jgi:hypothetical protein|nr:hypothetical protein [Bryobacteraceae bacterium]
MRSVLIPCLLLFYLEYPHAGLSQLPAKPESKLAVIDAGAEDAESAPFVASDYRFLPGQTLYFEFDIAGFGIRETGGYFKAKHISLEYAVQPFDANNVGLAPAVSGKIDEDLAPQDKNWLPKRRASFLLPAYVARGQYHVRVMLKDLVAKTEASSDIPFLMNGATLTAGSGLTIENFRFLRSANDGAPLQLPDFRAGDTVYARFDITGFKLGEGNAYDVAYGLKVLRPDGKTYLDAPQADDLRSKSLYPAPYVPGNVQITTSRDSSGGSYILILTAHDAIGNQTFESRQSFQLE